MKPRLVVSVGCPAGIGPEVSVRAALASAEQASIVLVGDLEQLRSAAAIVGAGEARLRPVDSLAAGFATPAQPGELCVWQPSTALSVEARRWGAPSAEGGRAQLVWIDVALAAVRAGEAGAMVTGPASKSAIVSGGAAAFRGHTEHLAQSLGTESVTMAFASDAFTCALVTTHLPLSAVPSAITEAKVAEALEHLGAYVAARAGRKPATVAICGLNPHAGEGGLLGHEEDTIRRGMALATARGLREVSLELQGPLPAEAAFRLAKDGAFAGVLAMYHDQATIPTKLLGFGEAVNVSLGLPIVRTSVDHGTAYDQAGRGSADARGMQSAIALAAQLARAGHWPFTATDTASRGLDT